MQAEFQEITRFLQDHPPFDELPEDALQHWAQQAEISYIRAGQDILSYGDAIQDLYVIRSGAVESYRRNGELYNRLDRGDTFGEMALLMNRRVRFPAKALEDTLVYCLPADTFDQYCEQFEFFSDYFEAEGGDLLRRTLSRQADGNDLTTVKIKSLISREAVTVTKDMDVPAIARTMNDERVSSILVTDPDKPIATDPDDDDGQVVGIITDRDLRSRVLAQGLPLTTHAADIMSSELVMIDDNAYVFEAMLTMLRQNVHHLPVVHRSKPIGVVALSDIVQHESQNSLLFVRSILSQSSVDDLARLAQQLPSVFVRMVNEDANSHMIGSAMAVIGRTFKQRLLELAEETLGPPPLPYCFLALGSMARDEQLIVTDQDNAIILDNGFDEATHGAYFQQLADFVCDGLAACGYHYCDGDIMAKNPEWRLTLKQWQQQFSDWIENPSPKALLHSSIFFDLDGVYGKEKWADQLTAFIAKKARQSSKFLAYLARNSLNRTPPLGFFKGFVMEQDGRHNNSINLKRRGTAPLSDVIRVHALAVGSRAQNSFERLDDIIRADLLPKGKGRDLSDALEYIAMVRIRHQALDIERGDQPDNNIEPDNLSTFERRNLKEAFQVLDKAQDFLKFRYQAGRPVDVK
jgi:CBS domain-containing protein